MSAPLKKGWIKEQLELCEKATKGPWQTYGAEVIVYAHPSPTICSLREAHGSYPERMDNAEFIVAAREGYLLVLNEVQQLRKRQCTNCTFYAYYDGPLCGLREEEDWFLVVDRAPEDWFCAEWKTQKETADAGAAD